MEEKSNKLSSRSSPVNHLLRRLRYQGAAQWVTLLLVSSCVGLFMFTSSFNSSLIRRQALQVQAARSNPDTETGGNSDNDLPAVPGNEDVASADKADDLTSDLVEEAVPEFTGLNFWDGVDWDDPLELPDKVAGSVFEMTVETGEEDIELKTAKGDIQVITVYFRESIPKTKSRMDILLLHGSRFNSETWITVDTTKTFAAMGYRATAIDLPGFGNSAGQVMFGEQAAQFIEAFCQAHGIKNPVIVAPSMSGGYALPYLMTRPYNVTALVALAPTSTERYKPVDYQKVQVPILTVYGTKDSTFGSQVQRRLGYAPNSQTKLIQDAHHATYLDQPDEWHRVAYILFRRLEAWAEKQKKAGITTTQHPPVVTHNIGETLPPEVTLPALNVPPMRKFVNQNGFDEMPTGTFETHPPLTGLSGTMDDMYGQVSAIDGKPVTPEEAAKIQAELGLTQNPLNVPPHAQGGNQPANGAGFGGVAQQHNSNLIQQGAQYGSASSGTSNFQFQGGAHGGNVPSNMVQSQATQGNGVPFSGLQQQPAYGGAASLTAQVQQRAQQQGVQFFGSAINSNQHQGYQMGIRRPQQNVQTGVTIGGAQQQGAQAQLPYQGIQQQGAQYDAVPFGSAPQLQAQHGELPLQWQGQYPGNVVADQQAHSVSQQNGIAPYQQAVATGSHPQNIHANGPPPVNHVRVPDQNRSIQDTQKMVAGLAAEHQLKALQAAQKYSQNEYQSEIDGKIALREPIAAPIEPSQAAGQGLAPTAQRLPAGTQGRLAYNDAESAPAIGLQGLKPEFASPSEVLGKVISAPAAKIP